MEADLYCKSTDIHQHLQQGSCHPCHVKKAIPYRQALRIRRICSDEKKFRMTSEELVGWLVDRGYKEDFVRDQIGKASNLDKAALFDQKSSHSSEKRDHIPLVFTFHPVLNQLRDIVRKLHTMLDASEEHRWVFKEQPLVVFRRPPNLNNSVVRAKLPKSQKGIAKGCLNVGSHVVKFLVYFRW